MFQKVKSVPEFSRRGQFIADTAGHTLISATAPRAYKLNDAAGRGAVLTALIATCRERGYHFETVYDAAHGGRYLAIVFSGSASPDHTTRTKENMGARKMAFDFICAPEHERFQSYAP